MYIGWAQAVHPDGWSHIWWGYLHTKPPPDQRGHPRQDWAALDGLQGHETAVGGEIELDR